MNPTQRRCGLWSMRIYMLQPNNQQPSRSRTAAIVRLYTLKLTHNLAWPKRHALEVWIGSFSSSIDIEKGTHCEMQHFGSRRRRGSSNSRSLFHDSCRWASYVSVKGSWPAPHVSPWLQGVTWLPANLRRKKRINKSRLVAGWRIEVQTTMLYERICISVERVECFVETPKGSELWVVGWSIMDLQS